MENKTLCHSMRFRKQSKRSKRFHFSKKNVAKHRSKVSVAEKQWQMPTVSDIAETALGAAYDRRNCCRFVGLRPNARRMLIGDGEAPFFRALDCCVAGRPALTKARPGPFIWRPPSDRIERRIRCCRRRRRRRRPAQLHRQRRRSRPPYAVGDTDSELRFRIKWPELRTRRGSNERMQFFLLWLITT